MLENNFLRVKHSCLNFFIQCLSPRMVNLLQYFEIKYQNTNQMSNLVIFKAFISGDVLENNINHILETYLIA